MTNITQVAVIPYRHTAQGTQVLLKKNNDNTYQPFSADHEAKFHHSETAGRVLGQGNYQTLLNSVQQFRNGVSKVNDPSHRKVVYLSPVAKEGDGALKREGTEGGEWVSASALVKALRAPSTSPIKISEEYRSSLKQFASGNNSVLTRVQNNEKPVAVIKPNQANTGFDCDLTTGGFIPGKNPIDREFLPEISLDNDLIHVDGETYSVTFRQGDSRVPLSKLSPEKKKALFETLKETIHNTTPENHFDAIKKISINFHNMALEGANFYGNDPTTPLATVAATSPELTPLKSKLDKVHTEVCKEVSYLPLTVGDAPPIRGIPRAQGTQTCWAAAALHTIAQLHGDKLELIKENAGIYNAYNDGEKQIFDFLLRFKRILHKEIEGEISETDMKNFLRAYGVPEMEPNDPEDLIGYVNDLLGLEPESCLSVAPNDILKTKIEEIAPADRSSELYVHVGRNMLYGNSSAIIKDRTAMSVDPRITLDNGDVYELVNASIHNGNSIKEGHYISYSYINNAWWEANDDQVTLQVQEKVLAEKLKTDATQLVYRKVVRSPGQKFEDAVTRLHSTSQSDKARWLDETLVLDYAQRMVNMQANCSLLKPRAGSIYKLHSKQEQQELEKAIKEVLPGSRAVVPIFHEEHAIAIIVDKRKGKGHLEFFDATGRAPPKVIADLNKKLKLDPIRQVLDDTSKWQEINKDGWRCGYYLLKYLDLRLDNPSTSRKAVAAINELRATHPNRNAISAFRVKLKRRYNRYRSNYGFAP